MKKKIISIFVAAAVAASMSVNLFTVSAADTAGNTEVYTSMSENEKQAFIDENLDVRLQNLSTLVTLTANRAFDKIAGAVEAALNDGVTPVEIKEAIYHSGAYCGYTRAAEALDAADAALEALGEDVTYDSRITSAEETRYEDGLAVQRTLFGPRIGTITDDMSENMKLQTRYLSGICFGDFYNRTGLSLYTREFLTFCTTVGNGNCAGQLVGHINGNLSVGHSKDMLRAAVLLNEGYNGEEKTVLALQMIDSVEGDAAADPAPERPQPTETIEFVSALRWIQDNIEQFGGDPDNVTVFGESGGGAKVLALMTSPYAKGLFHKGIVESGATENMGAKFTDLDVSRALTENILENLGITPDRVEELQNIPYEELAAASDRALVTTAEERGIYEAFVNGYFLLWEPVVDGDFLPTGPVLDNGFAENGRDIPLLIGFNLNEWTVFGTAIAIRTRQ